jgi:hemerythrin-like domain-containing protein
VRRHKALVGLSEEHHGELVQARRLLRAAQGADDERLAAADAYVEIFFAETVGHFRREEEELFPLYRRHAGGTQTLERILREHMELHGLARALRAEVAGGSVRAETLRTLGTLLRSHVRLEERELFEAIQQTVPLVELDHLG